MRLKLVPAALMLLASLPVAAQVAPAVKIGGLPIGVGAALSDYSLDYGPGRRMFGVTAWADYNVFRGLGIEAKGTSIFAGKPEVLTRMRQDTAMGGIFYKYRQVFKVRPYVAAMGGLGSIDFPSRNPLYTHDTFTTYALDGGGEYRVFSTLSIRAVYEYQFWPNYHGKNTLDPNGFTVGATYYLRSVHRHY